MEDITQEKARKDLGALLRELREERLLTQQEVAQKMGTTSQVVSRVEGGHRNVSLEWLVKHANACGLSLEINKNISWSTTTKPLSK